MDSRDGITISDNCAEGNPLIFVNAAFERMTGYSFEEITNINCRYLQNNDRDQPELEIIHKAIEEGVLPGDLAQLSQGWNDVLERIEHLADLQ